MNSMDYIYLKMPPPEDFYKRICIMYSKISDSKTIFITMRIKYLLNYDTFVTFATFSFYFFSSSLYRKIPL